MATERQKKAKPDYAIPPGETLSETLHALGMTQKEFAIRTGLSEKHIVSILQGNAPITPETALKFETVLGVHASFWNNLERNYRDTLARLEKEKRLQQDIAWLDNIPVATIVKHGWIKKNKEKSMKLQEVLSFYGVSSPKEWDKLWANVRFAARQSKAFETDPGAVSAWMRIGELRAQDIACQPYNHDRFREVLGEVRDLTVRSARDFQPRIIQWCAEAGVAVVFVKELPRIRLNGITRWLNPNKALIQLCLRHKSNAQLWFTFFHEAGHILKHGKRDLFLENDEYQDSQKEKEADKFASDFLIPPREWDSFLSEHIDCSYSRDDIKTFAARVGIAPGIVVGRLQHERLIRYSHCNDLKVKLVWSSN
ncbi:MAG: HigA family addiction module antitoxin [Candidatus Alcyoniella australis]|nr:HigA family addiction module antitoxin [Candidatus Alcyoniella australis]